MSSLNKTNDIELLIEKEEDAKIRAILIVMGSLNHSVIASASLIKDISLAFQKHLDSYDERTKNHDALINKGKGAWVIGAWLLGIVQVIVVATAGFLYTEMNQLKETAVFNKTTNVAQGAEIKAITETLKAK